MLDHKGPPPVISGFTYLERLGAGGYSTVYLFEQHMPRREVAVKVMNADVEDKTASRFESEANLMARVSSHPAILSIYGAGVSADGHPFLVMEYCPPPQLGAILRQGPLNVAETLSTAIQIAGAVETAHRAGIVHRLDRDTSGLLVCARSERAFASLTAQLASRQMGRRYLAIACGQTPAQGTVEGNIGRDERNRLRMAVVQPPAGKPARTHYRLLAASPDAEAAAILCKLESGRTHQIRVHMAHIGHPLVGDTLYGGKPLAGFARQALHAWQLQLIHPATQQSQVFTAPIPPDLQALAAALQIQLPEQPPAASSERA